MSNRFEYTRKQSFHARFRFLKEIITMFPGLDTDPDRGGWFKRHPPGPMFGDGGGKGVGKVCAVPRTLFCGVSNLTDPVFDSRLVYPISNFDVFDG